MHVTDMGPDLTSTNSFFFRAVRTTEAFFPSVGTDVYRQVGLAGGAVTVVGTLVRFLSGVFPVANFEVTRNICI